MAWRALVSQWSAARIMVLCLGMPVLGLSAIATASRAYEIRPMTFDIGPKDFLGQREISIRNTHTFPLTLEVEIAERFLSGDGEEARRPADDDFAVFPPQTTVPPGKSQTIRLQWLGSDSLGTSKSYYITIRQLPIDLGETAFQGIRFLTNFAVACHVIPPGTTATPVVSAARIIGGPDAPLLSFMLANRGTRVFSLHEAALDVEAAGSILTISAESLRAAIDRPVFLPGARRVVSVPLTGKLAPQPAVVQIRLPVP